MWRKSKHCLFYRSWRHLIVTTSHFDFLSINSLQYNTNAEWKSWNFSPIVKKIEIVVRIKYLSANKKLSWIFYRSFDDLKKRMKRAYLSKFIIKEFNIKFLCTTIVKGLILILHLNLLIAYSLMESEKLKWLCLHKYEHLF